MRQSCVGVDLYCLNMRNIGDVFTYTYYFSAIICCLTSQESELFICVRCIDLASFY